MAVDDFAPRLSFNFTCWGKIFEEVAKFRAGRRLYARMMRERFGATNPKSWMFRSLIGGGGSAFTVQEPENNIVRGAYIALAAALAGAQTMALPTYDEAYTIPSAKAQLIALRTMQICAEEIGRGRHRRPARRLLLRRGAHQRDGGQDPRRSSAAVERMGGIVEAVRSGAIQAEVARQAYLLRAEAGWRARSARSASTVTWAKRRRGGGREVELYAFDARAAEAQVARLAPACAASATARAVAAALRGSRDEARGTANLMPAIMEAVTAYATLGEINRAMKDVFGEHKEPVRF